MTLRKIELPESQLYIYESKHLPGEHVSPHYHDICEILFFLDGEGCVQLQDKAYEVNPNQMVFIAPGTEHTVFAKSKMTLLVLAFGNFLAGMPGGEVLFKNVLNKSKHMMLDAVSASELRGSFRKILYEQTRDDDLSSLVARSHLLNALLVLARLWEMGHFSDSNSHRAHIVKHYIDTRYFERLAAEDLANILKITSRHMNNIFKQQFQLTPMQYLTEVRIKRAKELLIETNKEVVSICFETGFETLSTFYRIFKKGVGVAPQQFRKGI